MLTSINDAPTELASRFRRFAPAPASTLCTLAVAACLVTALTACAAPPAPPETVVLIVIDTLRGDHLSHFHTGRATTPNIDRLAAHGASTQLASASFHQTTMSMAALFTGQTPSLETGDATRALHWSPHSWCGMARFALDPGDSCIPSSVPTLAESMRSAGFWTIGICSNPLLFRNAGFARGFDDWSEVGERFIPPQQLSGEPGSKTWSQLDARRRNAAQKRSGSRVNAAVAQAVARRPADRLFLFVHYMDAHDYLLLRTPYHDAVAKADAAVGELIALLEKKELLDRSVIVLSSDHGERLAETYPINGTPSHNGNPSFECVVRVPLVISPRPNSPLPLRVSTQDLFQLVQDLASASAAPFAPSNNELFLSEREWQTLRVGRWKSSWARDHSRTLLFDLASDPDEQVDVAADHADVLRAHRQRLDDLTTGLASATNPQSLLSTEDEQRLDSLGYRGAE